VHSLFAVGDHSRTIVDPTKKASKIPKYGRVRRIFTATMQDCRMRPLLNGLANVILPPQCMICRELSLETGLCPKCWAKLEPIAEPCCTQCGRALPYSLPQGKCGQCWLEPPPITHLRAWCHYNDVSRAAILKFKHGDGLILTPFFAAVLARLYAKLVEPESLVVPVPLHWRRYLRRRYNQAGELARHLVANHKEGLFCPNVLRRRKPTKSQAGLNRLQRRHNLSGAFELHPSATEYLQQKRVLLIDDVLTTGATLNEAARTLIAAGSGPVNGLVIARVN